MSDAIMITLDLASALANASRTPRHDQAFKLIDSTPSPDMLMSEKAAFISSPLSLTPSSVRSRSSSPLLGAQARWQEATSSHSGQHRRRRRVAAYLLLALGLATLVLAAYWHRRPLAQALDEVLEDIYLDKQDNSPYKRMGELLVNEIEPDENVWRPFEGAPTPAHMRKLRQQLGVIPSGETPVERRLLRRSHRHRRRVEDSLSWLTDATVLLVGDSIERLHAADFCDFVGGKLELITPLHVASPPTYRKPVEGTPDEIQGRRALEDSWEARGSHWHITRPYVCTVPRYNATLITTFTWGLGDMEKAFATEEFFYGPSAWIDRFEHITIPLLDNLATYLGRPQVRHPDFIELCSGFWDLRQFTEQDMLAAGFQRPYPNSQIPFGPIGLEREREWAHKAREVIKRVARQFPSPVTGRVRDGPVISWRSLHVPPARNQYTPFTRAPVMDRLSRLVMGELQAESRTHSRRMLSSGAAWRRRLGRLFGAGNEEQDEVDYGFDERLRINEWGALLSGHPDRFRDFLHPSPLPGGYLWGDIMLDELQRARSRQGRSSRV